MRSTTHSICLWNSSPISIPSSDSSSSIVIDEYRREGCPAIVAVLTQDSVVVFCVAGHSAYERRRERRGAVRFAYSAGDQARVACFVIQDELTLSW